MAGEFKHKSAGIKLEQAEDDAIERHLLDSGVEGDFIYWDATSLCFKRIAHQSSLSPHLVEILPNLLKGGNVAHIPTTGWTTAHAGSGYGVQTPTYIRGTTGATASSKAVFYTDVVGLALGDYTLGFDWGKKLYLIFGCVRVTGVATAIGRTQLKQAETEGALAAKGLGIRVDNLALIGESFGTELGTVDLGTTLGDYIEKQIIIILDPSVPKIEWYVNGVLKGTQSTAAKIPSGLGSNYGYLVHSIINGATTTSANWFILIPRFWQAR